MRNLITLLLFSSLLLGAAEPVIERGELIYEETFTEELSSSWKSSKGNWQVNDGRLVGQEPKGNNHAVHLSFTPEIEGNVIIEIDMLIKSRDAQAGIMFHPGKSISSLRGHLGRATLNDKFFRVQKDKSRAVKKEKFSKTPTEKWFHLILEMVDDTVIAHFNGKEHIIKHEDFKKAHKKKLILIAEKTVEYKNFKIYETSVKK